MDNLKFYDQIDNRINKLSEIFKNNEHLKKQNENGKKSFSFLLWFLERYLPNQELSELENYITEGNDDSSCDLIFSNTDQAGNETYYVVQAKWFAKQNINKSKEITKEIKACLTDFRLILSGKKESEHNDNFNRQYNEFLAHKRNNGKVKFIFLALCNKDVKINEHIEDFISPLVSFQMIDFFTLKQQYIELEYKGVKTHNPIETPYLAKTKYDLEFIKKEFISVDIPFKSKIFLVRPKEIYNLFEKYGQSLFYKNIRNPLPNSYFNEEIKNTILNNPVNFWYFNNGITAITDSIDPFHNDSTKVTITGIQVINGAQTVFSIYQAYKFAKDTEKTNMDENALITFRVVKSGGTDFDLKVTRFTNSQNPISERDFHSNDDIQKQLQSDFFEHTNIWYETRRGEFRKKLKDTRKLTNEMLALNYLAYFINDPFNAKQNKKLVFLSKDINKNGLYEIIFNNDTKYDDMQVAYYLNLFIDKKRKEIKAQIDSIDTTEELSKEDEKLLEFAFIQYANYEFMALFKILLYESNKENLKSINGKLISYFDSSNIKIIEANYDFIKVYILAHINKLKELDSKIVNSVIFKNKEFYVTLKNNFISHLAEQQKDLKNLKL